MTAWLMIAGGVIALGAAACVIAMWLRSARLPGGAPAAALVGGALAGSLLGATVMSRVAPELFHEVFIGNGAAAAELAELESQQRAEIAALRELDVTPIAIDERRAQHAADAAPLREAVERARDEHQLRRHNALTLCVMVWVVIGSVGAARRSHTNESLFTAPSAAVALPIFAGAPAFLLLRWFTDASVAEAVLFAAAIAIGGAHLEASSRRLVPPRARRSVERAAAGALVISAVIVMTTAPGAATGALVFAAAAGAIITVRARARGRARRMSRDLAVYLLLPLIAALVVAPLDLIDLADDSSFWLAFIIGAVFCADGRWLGAWIGWRAAHASTPWARGGAMLGAGVGGMQIAIAGFSGATNTLPPAFVAAAVASALFVELTSGARRWFLRNAGLD